MLFNDDFDSPSDRREWRNFIKGMRKIGWKNINAKMTTMSFHPVSVYFGKEPKNREDIPLSEIYQDKGDRTGNYLYTLWTDGSYVAINDSADTDTEVLKEAKSEMVTGSVCEQMNLFLVALASAQRNNSGTPDPGRYGFGYNNCGRWAKTMVERVGLEVPNTNWNLGGTGMGGMMDKTGIPQIIHYSGGGLINILKKLK